jgi:hypothetical protein
LAQREIPGRFPLPAPLSWAQFEASCARAAEIGGRGVTIRDRPANSASWAAPAGAAVWNSDAGWSLLRS